MVFPKVGLKINEEVYMRNNRKEKRKMVDPLISKRKSIVSISKEFGIDYRELKRLVARVREHGIDEVFKKKEHPYYEYRFKTAVVENYVCKKRRYLNMSLDCELRRKERNLNIVDCFFMVGIIAIIFSYIPNRYINNHIKYLFYYRKLASLYPFFVLSLFVTWKLIIEKRKKEIFALFFAATIFVVCSAIVSIVNCYDMLRTISIIDIDLLPSSIRKTIYSKLNFNNFKVNFFISELIYDIFSNVCQFKDMYWVSFCLFLWYKDNLDKLKGLFFKGYVFSFCIVFIYEMIELPYLFGFEKAKDILIVINPFFYDIATPNWWPPLLWPNQLRGPFAEPSYFGYYLGIAVCVFTYLVSITRKSIINNILLFLSLFFCFLTNSRTGIMLAIGGEFIFCFLALVSGKEKKKLIFIILTFLLAYISADSLSNFDINHNSYEKQSEILETISTVTNKTARSNISRFSYFKATFDIGKEHFFFGVGTNYVGTYISEKMEDMNLKSPEMEKWIELQSEKGYLNSVYPILNYYTYLFAIGGLVFLILYLGLFVFELLLYLVFIIKNGFKAIPMFSIMIISMFAVIFAMGFSNGLMSSYIYVIAMGIGLCDLYQLNALKFFKKPQTVNEVVVSD